MSRLLGRQRQGWRFRVRARSKAANCSKVPARECEALRRRRQDGSRCRPLPWRVGGRPRLHRRRRTARRRPRPIMFLYRPGALEVAGVENDAAGRDRGLRPAGRGGGGGAHRRRAHPTRIAIRPDRHHAVDHAARLRLGPVLGASAGEVDDPGRPRQARSTRSST